MVAPLQNLMTFLPELLKSHNYLVGMTGKVFHMPPDKYPSSWFDVRHAGKIVYTPYRGRLDRPCSGTSCGDYKYKEDAKKWIRMWKNTTKPYGLSSQGLLDLILTFNMIKT